jgi:bacterioferritin-associated ferredoxin
MDACHTSAGCADCSVRFVCRCLRITEEIVLSAVRDHDIQTLKDLRTLTGAGDGCTACHQELRRLLALQTV